jgi:hypothetical protein
MASPGPKHSVKPEPHNPRFLPLSDDRRQTRRGIIGNLGLRRSGRADRRPQNAIAEFRQFTFQDARGLSMDRLWARTSRWPGLADPVATSRANPSDSREKPDQANTGRRK